MRRLGLFVVCLFVLATSAAAQGLPQLPADVCDRLKAERMKYPAVASDDFLGVLLNAVAFNSPGFGVNRKAAGHNCPSPAGLIACDILQRSDGFAWDVIIGDEAGTVTCGQSIGKIEDNNRPFVPAVDPGGVTPVDPPPTPGVTKAELHAEIIALREALWGEIAGALADLGTRIDGQIAAVAGSQAEGHAQILTALEALDLRPLSVTFPVYTAVILGQRVTLRPVQ